MCPGADFSVWGMQTPSRDTAFMAAPALGAVLPVDWWPEASWPTAIRRTTARRYGNDIRVEPCGGLAAH